MGAKGRLGRQGGRRGLEETGGLTERWVRGKLALLAAGAAMKFQIPATTYVSPSTDPDVVLGTAESLAPD